MVSAAFPNRPFSLRDSVWLVRQEVENNRSLIAWELWIDKTAYSPTSSSGAASRWMKVNGDFVHESYGSGFNFVNGSNFLLASGQHWVPHNADGTKSVQIEAAATYDILGSTSLGILIGPLPTIPRASEATFVGGGSLTAGTAVTVNTNRHVGTWTHDITWIFGTKSGVIANGVGASTSWTPPLSMLAEIPTATSGTGTMRVVTKDGASVIGSRDTPFTLNAGPGVVPTIPTLSVLDDNSAVVSTVGAYVQGLSALRVTVNADGVQGSTITQRTFAIDGTEAASGSAVPLAVAGTRALTASATDSRGRVGTFSSTVNVLAYSPPLISAVTVRRSSASGVLDDNGTSLRVDLNAAVQSLLNGTQRNAITVRAFTRPRGGSVWTSRNVINGALTHTGNFVISGGANYPVSDSFEVRIEVSDKFVTALAVIDVATSQVYMHWGPDGIGFGKYHEQGAGDFAGDVYADAFRTDGVVAAGSAAIAGAITHRGGATVEPVGSIVMFAGAAAPTGWLLCEGQAVSRTTYAALWSAIGDAYGAGNGSSTFNVPNFKGRVPTGVDSAQTEFTPRGKTGGAKTHTLTSAQSGVPAHAHGVQGSGTGYLANGSGGAAANLTTGGGGYQVSSPQQNTPADAAQAHPILQPYISIPFIIKAL